MKEPQLYSLAVFSALYLNEIHGKEKYNPDDPKRVRKAHNNFNLNYRENLDQPAAINAAAKLVEMISARLNEDWGLVE